MSETKFQIGDVVKLKGGSPFMTVYDVSNPAGYIDASWFDTKKVLHRDSFVPAELIRYTPPTSEKD